jgi:anti-anti-sigma factor
MRAQHIARPVVIRVGDLDIYTVPGFLATIREASWAPGGTVILDLGDTEFFDEAGIEAIIAACGRAAASGCRLGVACSRWPIMRMLHAAGLDITLDIAASVGELHMPGTTSPPPMMLQVLRPQQPASHRDAAS